MKRLLTPYAIASVLLFSSGVGLLMMSKQSVDDNSQSYVKQSTSKDKKQQAPKV